MTAIPTNQRLPSGPVVILPGMSFRGPPGPVGKGNSETACVTGLYRPIKPWSGVVKTGATAKSFAVNQTLPSGPAGTALTLRGPYIPLGTGNTLSATAGSWRPSRGSTRGRLLERPDGRDRGRGKGFHNIRGLR